MCEETMEKSDERNIMILFLSNLHGEWLMQKDKVTGKDKRTHIMRDEKPELPYTIYHQEKAMCKETNEAPMADVLASLGKPLDAIFYFSTKQVGMYPLPQGKTSGKSITVLFPPDFNVPKEYDSEAHFFWTERAPKILGDKFTDKTRLVPVPFDESASDPMKSIIQSVTAMEQAIRTYLDENGVLEKGEAPLKHCHLYVDVTGGFRTANMVMSAVMQLLVYQDAKLERVVYSDLQTHIVSNVQPINDLYKLIEGVGAFKKYGSSAALDEYFKDVKEDCATLGNLLDAMNAFSESVLLCQPDDIVENLGNLVPQLENFKVKLREEKEELGEEKDLPAKVALFERMLEELKEIYTPMYPEPKTDGAKRKEDRIEIIKWCVDNTLLQQAVIFCVEWLPEFFEDHGIAYTNDQAVQLYCEEGGFASYRPGWKNFLMEVCTKSPIPQENQNKTAQECIAEIAQAHGFPHREYAYDVRRETLSYDKERRDNSRMGWRCWRTAAVSRAMLECGMMEAGCGVDKAVAYIRDYTYIRAYIRNKLDHANQQDVSDGTLVPLEMNAIQSYLQRFLERLEEQKDRQQILCGLWEMETREAKWKERQEKKKRERRSNRQSAKRKQSSKGKNTPKGTATNTGNRGLYND